jgi:hypothetical protein
MTDLDRRPRIQLTPTQVIASAPAATTATVAASYLGVAGTVIGAAIASVLTVVGNAVYSHSIQRTSARVRTVVPAAVRFAPRAGVVSTIEAEPDEPAAPRPRRRTWPVLAAACVGVFVGVLTVITFVELVAGRPMTDVLHGTAGSGTSVLGDAGAKQTPTPTPTAPATQQVTVTVTPKVVTQTPTVTVTGNPVTRTVTPTTTTTPTAPTPTDTPTPTPSASENVVNPAPSAG